MRRSLFLFLMIFCAWLKVNSTGQVGDFIVIGNDTLAMLSLPIEVDSVLRLNVSQQIREVYPDGYITSCWRKYIATWKMEEEKLYLEDIMICPLDPIFYIPLDSVFAPYKDEQGRILASWFTGTLRVVKGKQIRYNHMGFDRNYEIETLYQEQNGNVIGKKTYHNAHRKSTLNDVELFQTVSQNFNWDLFPELSNKRLVPRLKILPNEKGEIDSLVVKVYFNKKELLSPHPYVIELERCLNVIPDWEYHHINGSRRWLEFVFLISQQKNKSQPKGDTLNKR